MIPQGNLPRPATHWYAALLDHTAAGTESADASEATPQHGTAPLLDLANAMQAIVTGYRLMYARPRP